MKKGAKKGAKKPLPTVPAEDRPLSLREQLFVSEYLIDLNGTQAAIRAGYSPNTAAQMASRLLRKVNILSKITAEMDERNKRLKIDADILLMELLEENRADLLDIIDEHGALKEIKDWPLVWRRGLITGLEMDEIFEGSGPDRIKIGEKRKVRFADRLARKIWIGKHTSVQAFNHKVQLAVSDPLTELATQILGNSIKPQDDGSGGIS